MTFSTFFTLLLVNYFFFNTFAPLIVAECLLGRFAIRVRPIRLSVRTQDFHS